MVRVGDFELRLVRTDTRTACPEVTAPDGRTYAVAAPGAPFNVCISRFINPADPYSALVNHNVSLTMDGRSVGYSCNLDALHQTVNFAGFLQQGDLLACTYSTFVFAQPVEDAAAAARQPAAQNLEAGTVKATIWQAVLQAAVPQGSLGPANTSTAVAKLPEGKKFFTAPSLVTGAGAPVSGPGLMSCSVQRFGPPTVIDLCYETASTLMLRRVLRPEISAHHAILQMFPETATKDEAEASGVHEDKEEDEDEDEEGGAGGSRKRRREGGAAQQRQQQQAGRRQRAEVVDLTRAPAPNDEILAANRAGKELVCDLTCDDDEQPHWHAVKKPLHRLG